MSKKNVCTDTEFPLVWGFIPIPISLRKQHGVQTHGLFMPHLFI